MKEDQTNKEIVSVGRCSSLLGTTVYWKYPATLLFRLAQIFGDYLPNTVFIHGLVTFDHTNNQEMITTHHLPYPLDIALSLACCGPPALRVIFNLLETLFQHLFLLTHTHTKNKKTKTRVRRILILSRICWSISCASVWVFPYQTKNVMFIRSSVLIHYQPE